MNTYSRNGSAGRKRGGSDANRSERNGGVEVMHGLTTREMSGGKTHGIDAEDASAARREDV